MDITVVHLRTHNQTQIYFSCILYLKNKLLSSYKGKKQMAGCINMKFSLFIACTVHMYSQKPKEFSHLLTIFYLTHHMYSQKPK